MQIVCSTLFGLNGVLRGVYGTWCSTDNNCLLILLLPQVATMQLKLFNCVCYLHFLDAYFCGHDHSLQHIYNAELTKMHHFVSGSGSGSMWYSVRAIPNYTVWCQSIGGFANVIIADGVLEVQFISEEGNLLHSSGAILHRDRPVRTTDTKLPVECGLLSSNQNENGKRIIGIDDDNADNV